MFLRDQSRVPLKEAQVVDFLLVGGGLASATAAETLRAAGAEGSIAILCAENTLPYYRPPLSKEFLLKGPDQTKILIHDHSFYRDRDIEIHLGSRVRRVDVDSRTIETDGGDHFRFGKLLIATGASVHRLSVPGANLEGIHYLRTVNDALSLYQAIAHAQRAIVDWSELPRNGDRGLFRDAGCRDDLDRERGSRLREAMLAGGVRFLCRIFQSTRRRFHFWRRGQRVLGQQQRSKAL